MINLFSWLPARYRPWDKAIDPRDTTVSNSAKRRHFEIQRGEQVVLQEGVKTQFGQLLMRTLIDNLHDLEVKSIWNVKDWDEFVRLKVRREVAFELLTMIGASEQRMRDIERVIEGIPSDDED